MDANAMQQQGHEEDDEEEFALLDLDVLSGNFDIPPNAPYVLSVCGSRHFESRIGYRQQNKAGELNIGEYEETIGTCFAFAEDEAAPMVHEEAGSSELNLFSGKCIIDSNQAPRKQVKPVARLHKILKFRILLDGDVQNRTTGPSV
ncbi:hypothetical protein CUMW_194860 [Citrus unshiu]|nr:hypothetical protein CUMW_194860 [Citrus unshiu]